MFCIGFVRGRKKHVEQSFATPMNGFVNKSYRQVLDMLTQTQTYRSQNLTTYVNFSTESEFEVEIYDYCMYRAKSKREKSSKRYAFIRSQGYAQTFDTRRSNTR